MKTPTPLIIIFLLFSFHSFAQTDLIKELRRLDGVIVKKETENNKLKAEISNLEESIKKLKVSLDSVIGKENKQIIELKDSLKNKELYWQDEKSKYLRQARSITKSEVRNAKKRVFAEISNYYQKSFRELVLDLNIQTIDRDKKLLKDDLLNNIALNKKLDNLLIYFNSKALLDQKFNKIAVDKAIKDIDKIINPPELVKKLNENLKYYEETYLAFEECIGKIIEIDLVPAYDNEKMKKYNLNEIFYVVATYIKDNNLSYNNYTYIMNNLINIIDKKRRNSDMNINEIIKN
tara:strand:+ start:1464 stop:2336 length:873 start_codon:yes stop_codon:yes gene_type:complete